ncbi:hypothetical protein [Nakamurella endophytica]|uniref:Uncharacterized protein n=1 Tax=Nakamurella endophytica TaxID=1748367 RepID=A0A917WLL9_9ACTN|nr:hypothetical protein [Nakamurella endophytica]GGM13308.1 hypothetical protein GCM10011594_36530 [Nakamurella endophytica]
MSIRIEIVDGPAGTQQVDMDQQSWELTDLGSDFDLGGDTYIKVNDDPPQARLVPVATDA